MILKINLWHDKMRRYNFTPSLPHVPSNKIELKKKTSCIKTVKVVHLFFSSIFQLLQVANDMQI